MSYTFPVIPIGRDETDRRLENVINRLQRHCKIGKVTPAICRPTTTPVLVPQPIHDDFTFKWPMVYADKGTPAICRQCIGKACGNAACPSRLIATC